MANLAELILNNRAQLTTLIAAYDAETAGAEINYQQRLQDAEAGRRIETQAALEHFEEALDRMGLSTLTIEPAEDAPLSGMVLHPSLPEPLSDLVAQEKYRNGIGEAEPATVGEGEEPAEMCGGVTARDGTRDAVRPDAETGQRMGDENCPRAIGESGGTDPVYPEEPAGGTTEAKALTCPDCGKPTPTGKVCSVCKAKRASAAAQRNRLERERAAITTQVAPTATETAQQPVQHPVQHPSPKIELPAPDERDIDLSDTPALAPSEIPSGDIPDYLAGVAKSFQMEPGQRSALNAEIHAGLQVFRPGRFEIHQDASGQYYAVQYREAAAPGCREILWIQYSQGRPYPTFFPQKKGAK